MNNTTRQYTGAWRKDRSRHILSTDETGMRSRALACSCIDPSAGLVSGSRGVDVGEPPLELAVVGARPLDVEQVAGLADAVQEAVVAQLPAIYMW